MCDLIWSDGPMNTKSDSCWTRWPMRPVWNRGLSDSVPHFFLTEVYLTHNCVRLRCTPVDFVLLSLLLTSDFFPLSLKFPWSFCTLFLSCPTEVTTGAAFSLQLSFRIFSKKVVDFPSLFSWETWSVLEKPLRRLKAGSWDGDASHITSVSVGTLSQNADTSPEPLHDHWKSLGGRKFGFVMEVVTKQHKHSSLKKSILERIYYVMLTRPNVWLWKPVLQHEIFLPRRSDVLMGRFLPSSIHGVLRWTLQTGMVGMPSLSLVPAEMTYSHRALW